MSNDFDIESDYYQPEEEQFYQGFVSPADEWNVKPDSLFSELNGSIFEANNAITRRLKRLNEVIAYAESKDNKKFCKKTRLSNQYNFLQQFIPENTFTKITEILSFLSKDKKKIAKDIGLNLDTIANILSLWRLELYSTGNFVAETTFEEINQFLKESSSFGNFKCRGHISSKDVDRAESRILRQIYTQLYYTEEARNQPIFPARVLSYYQEFMHSLDLHLNEKQRVLQEKQSVLPFHMYLLTQKMAILKKILPKIALDYFRLYIESKDFEILKLVIDEFYHDKSAMVGELITQGVIILEKYYSKEALITKDAPTKFLTRLRKYNILFGSSFEEVITSLKEIKVEEIPATDNVQLQTMESEICLKEEDSFLNISNASISMNKTNILMKIYTQKELNTLLLDMCNYFFQNSHINNVEPFKKLLLAITVIILVWKKSIKNKIKSEFYFNIQHRLEENSTYFSQKEINFINPCYIFRLT